MPNIVALAAWVGALLISSAQDADTYPSRPLRMILPSAPGGLPDIQAG